MAEFFEKKHLISRRNSKGRGRCMKIFFDDSLVEDYFLQLLPEVPPEESALRQIGAVFPRQGAVYGMYGEFGLTIVAKKNAPMTCRFLRYYLDNKDHVSHGISREMAAHMVNCEDCREIALKSLELELPINSSPTGTTISAIIRRQTER